MENQQKRFLVYLDYQCDYPKFDKSGWIIYAGNPKIRDKKIGAYCSIHEVLQSCEENNNCFPEGGIVTAIMPEEKINLLELYLTNKSKKWTEFYDASQEQDYNLKIREYASSIKAEIMMTIKISLEEIIERLNEEDFLKQKAEEWKKSFS